MLAFCVLFFNLAITTIIYNTKRLKMNDLKSLLRWAFYFDFGTSPERMASHYANELRQAPSRATVRVLSELSGCSPEQLNRSHFLISINDFLRLYKSNIIEAGRNTGINAAVIAAVIRWEFLKNLIGRGTDDVQLFFPGQNDGIGWGSMHTQEAISLTDERNLNRVACIRMDAVSIIPLIAQFIKNCVDEYFDASNGIYIGNDLAVMAYFYNTGMPKVQESARRNRIYNDVSLRDNVRLNVTVNEMARWVTANHSQFIPYNTTPQIPDLVKAYAVGF